MKIGINASFINLKSGIATYTHNLIKYLQAGNDYHDTFSFFLSRHSYIPGFFDESVHEVRTYAVPAYNSVRKALWEQLRLPGEIRKSGADIFHSPAFIAPVRSGVPSVVTVHDLAFIKFPGTIPLHKRAFYNTVITQSIRRARHIITISNAVKEDLSAYFGIPEDRITVTYPGIGDAYKPVDEKDPVEPLLREHGITKPFFLFVGVIEPRKNLVRILEAFARLQDEGIQLVIAGKKGWLYRGVFRKIRQLKLESRVVFTGDIPSSALRIFYSACLSFVFASLYEGFGLPVAEAMACGAPVITSDRPAMAEVAGGAALLVDPEQVDSIAAAMKRAALSEILRSELSAQSRARAAAFSWKECARKTIEVYHRV